MIVVPSIGRAGKSSTIRELQDSGAHFLIATPEVKEYDEAYDREGLEIYPVPYGIGKARQCILDMARRHKWEPFWFVDDDITGTFWRDGKHLIRQPLVKTIEEMDRFLGQPVDLALAGPNWRQRAWNAPAVEEDRHVGAIVRVNPEAPINYPEHMGEDLAVVLQAITAGWHTKRLSAWAYDTPPPASRDGGCREDYAAGKMEEGILALVAQYDGLVSPELSVSTGTMRAKVDWKTLDRMTP